MAVQLLALAAIALLFLCAREHAIYQDHKAHAHDRLTGDAEVAMLEDWFDVEWVDWPRA